MTTLCLHVPRKDDCINELRRLMPGKQADIHVFPESFLSSEALSEALSIIREANAFVIAGYRDSSHSAPREKALVIDRGEILAETTKCVLTAAKSARDFSPEAISAV